MHYPDFTDYVLLFGGKGDDFIPRTESPIEDADEEDHTFVGVVPGVDEEHS